MIKTKRILKEIQVNARFTMSMIEAIDKYAKENSGSTVDIPGMGLTRAEAVRRLVAEALCQKGYLKVVVKGGK